MSDPDKAIRQAAQNANWFGLSAAITAVLNLHEHEIADGYRRRNGTPMLRCLGCETVITHQSDLCATRREIARELGVSGGDQSEPTTPAPRTNRALWTDEDEITYEVDVIDIQKTATIRLDDGEIRDVLYRELHPLSGVDTTPAGQQ